MPVGGGDLPMSTLPTIQELLERIEDLENEREAIKELPEAVAQLRGSVETLQTLVVAQSQKVTKATSWSTALQFAAVVIVPLMIALIGGYFALKTAGVSVGAQKP